MRLTVRELDIRHCSEADYDTAVDLVHYEEERVRYVLELPSGAQLSVERTVGCTTRSYLEPDFELLEAGGELVYQQHASQEPATEESWHYVEVHPLFRARAIGQAEWGPLLEQDVGEVFDDSFDLLMFLESEEVPPVAGAEPLAWNALFEMVDALDLREGQAFDAEKLGADFVNWAQAVDGQAWDLAGLNLQARIDSRGALAMHRLQSWLDAKAAGSELQRAFSQVPEQLRRLRSAEPPRVVVSVGKELVRGR